MQILVLLQPLYLWIFLLILIFKQFGYANEVLMIFSYFVYKKYFNNRRTWLNEHEMIDKDSWNEMLLQFFYFTE